MDVLVEKAGLAWGGCRELLKRRGMERLWLDLQDKARREKVSSLLCYLLEFCGSLWGALGMEASELALGSDGAAA